MQLNEYENDPYAPRKDASQVVAAVHRARQDTTLNTSDAMPVHSSLPLAGGAVLIILLMIGMATWQLGRTPAKPLQITPGPSTAAFLAPPTAAPAPTSAAAMIRTIGAYAAPDGLLLGQIEENREIVPVAHYGGSWLAYQDGSGLVWVRRSDRPDLALVGPDLALVGPDLAPAPQGRGLTVSSDWTPPAAATPVPPDEPTSAPWPVSAPVAPDPNAPNIKEHLNAPRGPGQGG